LIFGGSVFVSAIVVAISHMVDADSRQLFLIYRILVYFIFLTAGIASFAFRHGTDEAILSHHRRQGFTFIVYSVLLIAWQIVFMNTVMDIGSGKVEEILVLNMALGALKVFLFSVSLFGYLRARDHVQLRSFRRALLIIAAVLGVCCVLFVVINLIARNA
jgi:hypothetical protein